MNTKLVPNLAASSLAVAVALAANSASAQTVITRTITSEPVETTVMETPTGTVVTRRPVDAAAPTIIQPAAPVTTVVETGPDTVDAITTRAAVRRAEVTRTARPLVTRQVSARPEPPASRAKSLHKISTARAATRSVPRLALSPRERHIIYRTIAERDVVPNRQVLVAPSATYVQSEVALQTQAPLVAADEAMIVETAAPITIGTVLPRNVPLFAVPQNVALGVPAIRSYSYAWLGGRAYLVEPATGVVVADVTE